MVHSIELCNVKYSLGMHVVSKRQEMFKFYIHAMLGWCVFCLTNLCWTMRVDDASQIYRPRNPLWLEDKIGPEECFQVSGKNRDLHDNRQHGKRVLVQKSSYAILSPKKAKMDLMGRFKFPEACA